ncbi:solute carrier family 15 member 4-like isoform X2 [Patiria miniata]|uniref:Solute carrier family 15 member 4 n=1 Tax=Patiria miniata TaxID=46514 RepID=A0A914A793_PATMI|nr:solute carrier family 15 member 4-like isoform X2 [Patiria miniata]
MKRMAEDSLEEKRPLINRRRASSSSEARGLSSPQGHTYGLSKWRRRGACASILLAVMFERLTFYGFSANLVMFLNESPFLWISYDAANAALIFTGLTYVSSVFGGLLADTLLGRFKTIVVSFILYGLGSVLLVLIGYSSTSKSFRHSFCGNDTSGWVPAPASNNSSVGPTEPPKSSFMYCGWAVYVSLVVIALGSGSLRSNLSPFGGDQVRYEGPKIIRTFFNWFYWAINVGSLIALLGVTALQQNVDFFKGLLVPAASLCVAAGVFVIGRTWYLSKKPMGSVLTNTSKIIIEAFKQRKARKMMVQRQDSTELFHSQRPPSFLDMAKVRYGGSFHESMVDDVKSLKKIILVFLGLTPYWVVYFQMQTTFLLQGLHLRFKINCTVESCNDTTDDFQIPPAWLSAFDVVAVLLFLPLFDGVLYPKLDRHGINFTLLRRMIAGMVFSMLAMIAAGVLEDYRLAWIRSHNETINQSIRSGDTWTVYHAADIWVFWQIPQYSLIGISEVFASVAGLEFAYSMAPRSMQGLIMGIFYFSSGIAALVGSAILKVTSLPAINWFEKKDAGNINNGHLDRYFYLLAAFQLVGLIIFAAVALYHERQEAKQRAGSTAINKNHHEDRAVSQT